MTLNSKEESDDWLSEISSEQGGISSEQDRILYTFWTSN